MLTFIKRLLGLGPAAPAKIEEEVKAIFIPQIQAVETVKVRAIVDSAPEAVKAAQTPKPANKRHRSRNRNKVKAGGTVAKVSEGTTKGGNGQVKPAQVATAKPAKPKAPVAKKK
jgi:hypothetical protein